MKFSLPKRKIRLLFYLALFTVAYITFYLIPKPEEKPNIFHFSPLGHARYKTDETGTVIFPSGKKLEMNNNYESDITYTLTNMQLTLKTALDGTFDPRLEMLHPHHGFLVTINRNPDEQDFCPRSISPLYPFSLRRLIYILPSELKPNQHVKKRVCSHYDCQWKSEELNNDLHVEIYCEATTEEHLSVIFSTTLLFTHDSPFYAVAHGNISVESPDISSSWQFSEFLTQEKKEQEVKDDKKIHTN